MEVETDKTRSCGVGKRTVSTVQPGIARHAFNQPPSLPHPYTNPPEQDVYPWCIRDTKTNQRRKERKEIKSDKSRRPYIDSPVPEEAGIKYESRYSRIQEMSVVGYRRVDFDFVRSSLLMWRSPHYINRERAFVPSS
jgi:hypothetical protein